jgi:hypothetical protein
MTTQEMAAVQSGRAYQSLNGAVVYMDGQPGPDAGTVTSLAAAYQKAQQIAGINGNADLAVQRMVGGVTQQADDLAYVVSLIYSVLTDGQKAALQGDARFAGISGIWAQVSAVRAAAAGQIAGLN